MAFTHQYTHAGATATSIPGSQVMLTSKSTHSPTSPSTIDPTRTLIHESGLPLLHFLPRMNGLAESVYGQGPLTPNGLGVEPSAFYPMSSPPGHLPGSPEQWKGLQCGQPPVMYPFDPMLAVHPYASFYGGLDLNNAARRKNATRETTSALKAWLYEHRKNPYPTKGEKIMLAIITKMTLTQVSTWFANARRRLKKESKSGWTGKEGDFDDSDFETDGDDRANENPDNSKITSESGSGNDSDDEDIDIRVTSDLSDISDAEEETKLGGRLCVTSVSSSTATQTQHESNRQTISSPTEQSTVNSVQRSSVVVSPSAKPKIWSIDEIMNKDSTKPKNKNSCHQIVSCTDDETIRRPRLENHSSTESVNYQRQSNSGLATKSNQIALQSSCETNTSPADNSTAS